MQIYANDLTSCINYANETRKWPLSRDRTTFKVEDAIFLTSQNGVAREGTFFKKQIVTKSSRKITEERIKKLKEVYIYI